MDVATFGAGLDSFIFIDDNPVECNEVASKLPMVTVINVPPSFPTRFLEEEWVFDEKIESSHAFNGGATQEDSQRTQLYQQNLQRNRLMRSSASHKAFLSSLGVKIVFEDIAKDLEPESSDANTLSSFSRVLQLHQRTNQFNIATSFSRKLTQEKLALFIAGCNGDNAVVCAHVTDRFGHYGLVSVVLCRPDATLKRLHVDSFLLSCRALNRGVEHAMIRKVAEIAEKRGAETIEFCWEPTDRNEPARLLFSSLSDFAFVSTKDSDAPRSMSRDDKNRQSASCKGKWEISTSKAAAIAFLKVDEMQEGDDTEQTSTPSPTFDKLSSGVASVVRMIASVLVKLALRVLPKWLVSFVCARWRTATVELQQSGDLGLLRRSFHAPHSLNSFITAHIPRVMEGNDGEQGDEDELDEQENSKYRRKARHQTKVALLHHLSDENPDVIWSANRAVDSIRPSRDKDGNPGNTTGEGPSDVLILHRQTSCSTPQCTSSIQIENQCAFQRCRTCCYKIQRLVARTGANMHEKARQTACAALAQQFDLTIRKDGNAAHGVDRHVLPVGLCPSHQNARRRG